MGLEQAFKAVAREAEVQDTFVLFAAGHGTAVKGRFHLLAGDFYFDGDADMSILKHGIGQDKLSGLDRDHPGQTRPNPARYLRERSGRHWRQPQRRGGSARQAA